MEEKQIVIKEDLRYTCSYVFMMICIVLLTGVSVCVNSYINAVYALKMRETSMLRHSYYDS